MKERKGAARTSSVAWNLLPHISLLPCGPAMYLNLNCRPLGAQTASSAALVDNRPEPTLAISLHARRPAFPPAASPPLGQSCSTNRCRMRTTGAAIGRGRGSWTESTCFPTGNTRRPPLVQCTGRFFVPRLVGRGEGNPDVCLLSHAGGFHAKHTYPYKRKDRMRWKPVFLSILVVL